MKTSRPGGPALAAPPLAAPPARFDTGTAAARRSMARPMAQLQAAVRGALARRAGVAYSRTFRDGALGMEVVDLEVRALLIPGQAQALGVARGSVIRRFGGTELADGTADLVLAAASKPRPVVVDFWLRLPASRGPCFLPF